MKVPARKLSSSMSLLTIRDYYSPVMTCYWVLGDLIDDLLEELEEQEGNLPNAPDTLSQYIRMALGVMNSSY